MHVFSISCIEEAINPTSPMHVAAQPQIVLQLWSPQATSLKEHIGRAEIVKWPLNSLRYEKQIVFGNRIWGKDT
jgi:hypothetical protein